MDVYYLTEKIKIWGKYTGYIRLPHHMSRIKAGTKHYHIGRKSRLLNRLGRLIGRNPIRPNTQAYRNLHEWYFYHIYTRRLQPGSVYHLINFDSAFPFLERFGDKAPKRLISTLHNPQVNLITVEQRTYLSKLASALVLYRRDIGWYEQFVGSGRVKFVPHGVNTDFFHPTEMTRFPKVPRLLFIGRIFRNTAMLARLVKSMVQTLPQVGFDLVVSAFQKQQDPHFQSLMDLPAVRWHSGISDERLRELYRTSYLLLMPLIDSGANNAIVEALACGLPIVTNGVGGVVDYGGGTIYPTVPNEDDDGMLSLIERYLVDFKWRNEIAAAGRDFAVSELAWPVAAERHDEVYEALCR